MSTKIHDVCEAYTQGQFYNEVPAYQPSYTDIKAPTVDERIKAITDTLIELKKERKELRKKKHQNIAKANYYELQLNLLKKEK